MATSAQIDFTQAGVLAGLPMPMTVRLPVPMTDEDIIRFSLLNRPYQIERNVEGELEIMSPVGSNGSLWEAIVIGELHVWARDHGGAVFSSNGGFTLPDGSMRSPDASWVSAPRWSALDKADRRRYAPLCPDFVIEILSETDTRALLEAKMQMWIANGAQLAWMIDPFAGEVCVYRPKQTVEVLLRPDFVEAERVVPGFRLEMSRLWDNG